MSFDTRQCGIRPNARDNAAKRQNRTIAHEPNPKMLDGQRKTLKAIDGSPRSRSRKTHPTATIIGPRTIPISVIGAIFNRRGRGPNLRAKSTTEAIANAPAPAPAKNKYHAI